jgi:hypothetical protein
MPGISAASPLATAFVSGLAPAAKFALADRPTPTIPLWRWMIRGTALDWFGPSQSPAGTATEPGILLDLHGIETAPGQRIWRVVDASGRPLLKPFPTSPSDRTLVGSLYLIEAVPTGSGWVTLAEAHVSARRSERELLNSLARAAVWLVTAAIQRLSSEGALRPQPFQPIFVRQLDRWRARLSRIAARLRDHLAADVWAICTVDEPVENFLASRVVAARSWFEIPPDEGFVADPFPWPGRDGVILHERYSTRSGRGTIEALVPGADGHHRTVPLQLNIASHLSYPFIYAEAGLVLCVPEMLWERRQLIYKLDPDAPPAAFCVVADDVSMADPTLFRHGGLYWIAYNNADLGLHENLCLRYASRLEGPWTPHPLNPVKMDIRSSRPGGTPFKVGGNLYRPAQDCSQSYGCAVVINRVITCTPTRYEEEPVARLTPDPASRYPDGLHTMSVTSHGIIFDGKRITFSGAITLRRFQRLLRSIWQLPVVT